MKSEGNGFSTRTGMEGVPFCGCQPGFGTQEPLLPRGKSPSLLSEREQQQGLADSGRHQVRESEEFCLI